MNGRRQPRTPAAGERPPAPDRSRRGGGDAIAVALLILQLLLAVRVLWRLLHTANGRRIAPTDAVLGGDDRVSVLVPVLNERERLAPCLASLIAQGPEVAEVLVIDGGSTDGTQELVRRYVERDARLRLVDAAPVPLGGNGKSHGLQVGLDRATAETRWLLTIDADVRPAPALTRSLVAHAVAEGVSALSVATLQELSGAAEGLLHPALLTTLVYRFGIPGHATARVPDVQANGQCFLLRRDALAAVGGFAPTRDSVCEDVTLARTLAAAGYRVGFYETDGLASVAMYAGWRDAWRNWTRSLPMRDRFSGWAGGLGLVEVGLVQALPLPLTLALGRSRRGRRAVAGLGRLNAALVCVRLGVLVGTARAYRRRPWTYWLSPASDVPAAVGVWLGAVRRRHQWRGRPIVRGGPE